MNLKTELKMSLLHDQGVKVDDHLESAHKRQAAHDGAKQALRQMAKGISGLAALVDRDVDDGKLPLDEPAKIAAYVKLMIDRCAQMALSASQHQENLQISVGGEISAYQGMVDSIKKDILAEQARVNALQQAVASGEIIVEDDSPSQADDAPSRSRPTGVRPGMGIAAQRKAEEMAETSEASDDATVLDAAAIEAISSAKPNGKRGRRKKDVENS